MSMRRVEGYAEYFENAEDKDTSEDGWSVVSDIDAQSGSAAKADASAVSSGTQNIYGPYTEMPAGRYEFSVRAKVNDSSSTSNVFYLDMFSATNDQKYQSTDFSADSFHADDRYEIKTWTQSIEHYNDWEFRVQMNFGQSVDLSVDWLKIEPV